MSKKFMPKNEPFTMRDVIRIAIAISNNNIGNYVNWKALTEIATMNMVRLAPDTVPSIENSNIGRLRQKLLDTIEILENLLRAVAAPLGMGSLAEVYIKILSLLREWATKRRK